MSVNQLIKNERHKLQVPVLTYICFQNFIVDTSDVVEMARPDSSSSPKSERKSPSRKRSPHKTSLKVGFTD